MLDKDYIYFTQIKRLEEENNELKYDIKVQENIINNLNNEVDDFNNKLDEIKIIVERLRTKIDYHSESEVNTDMDAIKEIIEREPA